MTPLEITLLLVYSALVILIIFLVALIVKICKVLNTLQKHLDDIGHEPREILQNINNATAELSSGVKSVSPFFRMFSNFGEALESKSANYKESCFWKRHKAKVEEPKHESNRSQEIADFVTLGLNLWQKYVNRR